MSDYTITFITTDKETQQRTQEVMEMCWKARQDKSTPDHAAFLDLVKKGVDVHAADIYNYNTILYWAVYHNFIDIAQMMIEQGSDIHARFGDDGTTHLHDAIAEDNWKIGQLLIDSGADIHARDNNGETPLYGAADYFESRSAIKMLLSNGANVWANRTWREKTPIDVDKTGTLRHHCTKCQPKLDAVMGGEFTSINATQDLYHLASVMKPSNPKNVPPPKEFIRTLFQQHLPHEPKFDAMYAEIFSHSRPPAQNLKATREAAKSRGVAL